MTISKFYRKNQFFLFNSIGYITVSMSYLKLFNKKTSRTFYMPLFTVTVILDTTHLSTNE